LADFKQDRVDQLLQYILAVAGQESGWERELGMIHLIKYTYLVDLTYAQYHKGQTYTGFLATRRPNTLHLRACWPGRPHRSQHRPCKYQTI
jgi:hypothetical protein